MKKLIGQLCLWSGFFVATFQSVRQLEVTDDPWSTISWFWYVSAIVLGAIGVVLLRLGRKEQSDDQGKTDAQYEVLRASIAGLGKGIVELKTVSKAENMEQVLVTIDDQMAPQFGDFADARQALAVKHGLQFYAEVMTPFASAERYVNRAWSAAADGYIDEVDDSLARAGDYIDVAEQMLKSAGE